MHVRLEICKLYTNERGKRVERIYERTITVVTIKNIMYLLKEKQSQTHNHDKWFKIDELCWVILVLVAN